MIGPYGYALTLQAKHISALNPLRTLQVILLIFGVGLWFDLGAMMPKMSWHTAYWLYI